MNDFDFDDLETTPEGTIDGFLSAQEERADLLHDYAAEISEAAETGRSAFTNTREMLDVAEDIVDLSEQVTSIGDALLATVNYGVEFAVSVQEVAQKLLALVEQLAILSTYSQDSAETLMDLVRNEIQE